MISELLTKAGRKALRLWWSSAIVVIPSQMGTATQFGDTLVWPSVNLNVISVNIKARILCRSERSYRKFEYRFIRLRDARSDRKRTGT